MQAPEELRDVTVAGSPFDGLLGLDSNGEVAIGWRPGDARDLVYVEVSGATAGSLGLCAFHDAEGRGALPRGLFGATGQGSLTASPSTRSCGRRTGARWRRSSL